MKELLERCRKELERLTALVEGMSEEHLEEYALLISDLDKAIRRIN